MMTPCLLISCFFFNDTATTEIYTLSLHDALPISLRIQILPAWWNSWWFRLTYIAALLLVAAAIYIYRRRQQKREEERSERLRQAQADLAHINRVSTMGELTASLPHELKQPIAAAVTNAKTCLPWLA